MSNLSYQQQEIESHPHAVIDDARLPIVTLGSIEAAAEAVGAFSRAVEQNPDLLPDPLLARQLHGLPSRLDSDADGICHQSRVGEDPARKKANEKLIGRAFVYAWETDPEVTGLRPCIVGVAGQMVESARQTPAEQPPPVPKKPRLHLPLSFLALKV